uniref:Uncharacterized protein n=1 Tax=Arundo donax TaxID=35708 RepID=A0A0A9HR30_ARUDO
MITKAQGIEAPHICRTILFAKLQKGLGDLITRENHRIQFSSTCKVNQDAKFHQFPRGTRHLVISQAEVK